LCEEEFIKVTDNDDYDQQNKKSASTAEETKSQENDRGSALRENAIEFACEEGEMEPP